MYMLQSCDFPIYKIIKSCCLLSLSCRKRAVVFIDRTFMDDTSPEEELLSVFMEMALDPEAQAKPSDSFREEEYLSLFMAHAAQESITELPNSDTPGNTISDGKLDIRFSKFIMGQDSKFGDVGVIRITSVVVPTSSFSVHAADTTLLCYVLSGSGEVIQDGKSVSLKKYDCAWIDCSRRTYFRAYPDKPWECAFVRTQRRKNPWTSSEISARLYTSGAVYMTFGAGTRFRSIIWELLSPQTEQHVNSQMLYEHLLLGLFNELTLVFMTNATRQLVIPDVIVGIQNYLDNNYFDEISLDDLSRKFGISKFHMSREFKRYIGKSPNDYLIDRRLDRAKELLSDSNRTVAEIGQLVGIPNPNHFLYLFKNREGLTPSAFRKRRI